MAGNNKIANSDFDPRHRIVGAAILIGFAVLAFSLLLDGNGDRREATQDVRVTVEPAPPEYVSSEEETRTFVSKITPIGGATPKAPPDTADSSSAPPPQKRAEPVSLANAGSGKPATREKPKAPEAPPANVASAGDPSVERGWMVRVGTFTDNSNVERVMKDLREKGFTPSSTPTKTASGSATRVWLGPYALRVEAARERSRLEQSTGEPGLITAYP
jgi:DedD protein